MAVLPAWLAMTSARSGSSPPSCRLRCAMSRSRSSPQVGRRLFSRDLIPHPWRMEAATWPLRLYQNLGIRRLVYALRLTHILPSQLRDMEAMLPRLPQRPLRQVLPTVTPARGETKHKVGFFLGCAQSLLFAEESAATVRVLSRNGCEVTHS